MNQTKQKSALETSTKASYGYFLADRPNQENRDSHGLLVFHGKFMSFVRFLETQRDPVKISSGGVDGAAGLRMVLGRAFCPQNVKF